MAVTLGGDSFSLSYLRFRLVNSNWQRSQSQRVHLKYGKEFTINEIYKSMLALKRDEIIDMRNYNGILFILQDKLIIDPSLIFYEVYNLSM